MKRRHVLQKTENLSHASAIAALLVGWIEACHDSSDCGAQNPRANHPDRIGVLFLHNRLIGNQTRVPGLQESAEGVQVSHRKVESS